MRFIGIHHAAWESQCAGVGTSHEDDFKLAALVETRDDGIGGVIWPPTSKKAASDNARTSSWKAIAASLGVHKEVSVCERIFLRMVGRAKVRGLRMRISNGVLDRLLL